MDERDQVAERGDHPVRGEGTAGAGLCSAVHRIRDPRLYGPQLATSLFNPPNPDGLVEVKPRRYTRRRESHVMLGLP